MDWQFCLSEQHFSHAILVRKIVGAVSVKGILPDSAPCPDACPGDSDPLAAEGTRGTLFMRRRAQAQENRLRMERPWGNQDCTNHPEALRQQGGVGEVLAGEVQRRKKQRCHPSSGI